MTDKNKKHTIGDDIREETNRYIKSIESAFKNSSNKGALFHGKTEKEIADFFMTDQKMKIFKAERVIENITKHFA